MSASGRLGPAWIRRGRSESRLRAAVSCEAGRCSLVKAQRPLYALYTYSGARRRCPLYALYTCSGARRRCPLFALYTYSGARRRCPLYALHTCSFSLVKADALTRSRLRVPSSGARERVEAERGPWRGRLDSRPLERRAPSPRRRGARGTGEPAAQGSSRLTASARASRGAPRPPLGLISRVRPALHLARAAGAGQEPSAGTAEAPPSSRCSSAGAPSFPRSRHKRRLPLAVHRPARGAREKEPRPRRGRLPPGRGARRPAELRSQAPS
jgi:hypothetical protein